MFNRKTTTAADYVKSVIEKEGLTEQEGQELHLIASFTKRPNETSPTLISAVNAWMCGSSVEEVKSFFKTEA